MEQKTAPDNIKSADLKKIEQVIGATIRRLPLIMPPASLIGNVLRVVEKEKRKRLLVKLITSSLIAFVSLIWFIFVWQSEGFVIMHSEAGKLLTLIFSDTTLIFQYWREYLLSLIESTPFVSLAIVGILLWITCASLWTTIQAGKIFINSAIKHA